MTTFTGRSGPAKVPARRSGCATPMSLGPSRPGPGRRWIRAEGSREDDLGPEVLGPFHPEPPPLQGLPHPFLSSWGKSECVRSPALVLFETSPDPEAIGSRQLQVARPPSTVPSTCPLQYYASNPCSVAGPPPTLASYPFAAEGGPALLPLGGNQNAFPTGAEAPSGLPQPAPAEVMTP